MKVSFDRPPNYAAIVAAFPHVATWYGVLFCYGDCIFNPDRRTVSVRDHAHEEVHSARQAARGLEAWWDRYLADAEFRFVEEARAHITEYRKVQETEPLRNARRFYLSQIAERLSGPLYGRLITIGDAKRLITKGGTEALDAIEMALRSTEEVRN